MRAVSLCFVVVVAGCFCPIVDRFPPSGSIVGTICSGASGTATAGSVALLLHGQQLRHVDTDDGQFLFAGLEGDTYEIDVRVEGEPKRRSSVVVPERAQTGFFDATCVPFPFVGTVSGGVCDLLDGEVADGAVVTVTDDDGGVRTSATDEEGTFLVDRIALGHNVVAIVGGGYDRAFDIDVDGDVFVDLGRDHCRAVTADTGCVSGRVCAGDGGHVELVNDDVGLVTDLVDRDHAWGLCGLAVGEWDVHVKGDDFDVTEAVVVEADGDHVVDVGCGE